MKKEIEKEKIQSRREFFKEAAKKALPVIGAIVLTSSPIIAQAAEKAPMGCQGSCYNSCQGCKGTCVSHCELICSRTCYDGCRTTCGSYCTQHCSAGCAHNLR